MEIIGHYKQKDLIKKIFEYKYFPNSLILSGPKGVGKSLIANNIAVSLLDLSKKINFNEADVSINQNIIKIEKIYFEDKKRYKQAIYRDDVSHLNDFFSTKNDKNIKRICIIDSIDDLSIDASNSILKIIEEPNSNNHFIIISHNSMRIMPTIRSRSYEIKFQNFMKEDFMFLIENFDDIKSSDAGYLYDLSHGSMLLSKDYIDYGFRDIDVHLNEILLDTIKVKSNTPYHYLNFLNKNFSDKESITSFFDFLILKKNYLIKKHVHEFSNKKVNKFLNLIDELNELKRRYITFNLSIEHILIHYFNLLKQ